MYLALAWVAPMKDFAILLCTNEDLDSFNAADEAVSQMNMHPNHGKLVQMENNPYALCHPGENVLHSI